jgi:hypothetical protein
MLVHVSLIVKLGARRRPQSLIWCFSHSSE